MSRLTEPQSAYINALRGLSALAVLVGHGLSMMPWQPALGVRYPMQSYAVAVFFILSGFLIGRNTMERSPGYSLSAYLIDRFSRIFVAFVPALIFVVMADQVMAGLYGVLRNANHTDAAFAANLLMLQHTPFDRYFDWLPRFEPYGTGRPFWTIAVEWWLYVLFGVAFFTGRMNVPERWATLVLIAPAAAVVLYFTAWESIAWVWICGAVFGMVVAYLPPADARFMPAIAGASVLVLGGLIYRFTRLDLADAVNFYDLQFILLTTCLFGLSLFLVNWSPIGNALISTKQLWSWIAGISYSLYLTHNTVLLFGAKAFGGMGWRALTISSLACILVAVAFTWAFDRHHKSIARRMKQKLANG